MRPLSTPLHKPRASPLSLLALLALLLIAASVSSYYFIVGSRSPFAFGGAHATATAQARGTLQAQGQSTAATQKTATVQSLATAQANPYSPHSGTLVIN